ncbi:MAG: PHP domain-containing protein [Propionibacteriaceae bacterium]|jgi:predicted metal-dependent phosphoesterase TrpH|nr:PHP domain-containing protein [Propionibacteriaceae bacterium]
MDIDLHTHSAISDGTDTLHQLVRAAHDAGLDAISLTDHDTMVGVDQAQRLGSLIGLEVLAGVELSTHVLHDGVERQVHVLGYGCRTDNERLSDLLCDIRQARRDRLPTMLAKLAELGMPLTMEEVRAQAALASSIGRPHVADAMVARGYVADRTEAFDVYLHNGGPADVPRYTAPTASAVNLITAAGGVAVLAHPWGRGNREVLTPQVIAGLAKDHGLYGIEVDHVDHTQADRTQLRQLSHELGLAATGSSDYHGTGKTRNPLGVFRTAPEVYETMRKQIEERGGQL